MTKLACIYPDREGVLVAYLYDEDSGFSAADRVAFETHVAACELCRSELAELRGVRATLGQWAAPDAARSSRQSPVSGLQSRAWWHRVPVWAQVAAAMVVFGASLSMANLDIRYSGAGGLSIRTGWSAPAQPAATPAAASPWRADLTAMQSQLRSEMRAQAAAVTATSAPQAAMSDAEFRRRARVLLDESEKKQESEMALRLTQLQIDVNAQREADLRRVNQNFRDVTSTYGGQLLKQQQQINYLLPVSQR